MSLSAAAPARHLAVIPDLRGLGQPALIVETAISRFSSAVAIFVPVREVWSSLSERSGAKSTAASENLIFSDSESRTSKFAGGERAAMKGRDDIGSSHPIRGSSRFR